MIIDGAGVDPSPFEDELPDPTIIWETPTPSLETPTPPTWEEFLSILRTPAPAPADPAGLFPVVMSDGTPDDSLASPAPAAPAGSFPVDISDGIPDDSLTGSAPAPAPPTGARARGRGPLRRGALAPSGRGKKKFNIGNIVLTCQPKDLDFLVEYEKDFAFDFPEMTNRPDRSQKLLWYLAEFE